MSFEARENRVFRPGGKGDGKNGSISRVRNGRDASPFRFFLSSWRKEESGLRLKFGRASAGRRISRQSAIAFSSPPPLLLDRNVPPRLVFFLLSLQILQSGKEVFPALRQEICFFQQRRKFLSAKKSGFLRRNARMKHFSRPFFNIPASNSRLLHALRVMESAKSVT